jgi:hypothetical protein
MDCHGYFLFSTNLLLSGCRTGREKSWCTKKIHPMSELARTYSCPEVAGHRTTPAEPDYLGIGGLQIPNDFNSSLDFCRLNSLGVHLYN